MFFMASNFCCMLISVMSWILFTSKWIPKATKVVDHSNPNCPSQISLLAPSAPIFIILFFSMLMDRPDTFLNQWKTVFFSLCLYLLLRIKLYHLRTLKFLSLYPPPSVLCTPLLLLKVFQCCEQRDMVRFGHPAYNLFPTLFFVRNIHFVLFWRMNFFCKSLTIFIKLSPKLNFFKRVLIKFHSIVLNVLE